MAPLSHALDGLLHVVLLHPEVVVVEILGESFLADGASEVGVH